jgi:hypothetical protein
MDRCMKRGGAGISDPPPSSITMKNNGPPDIKRKLPLHKIREPRNEGG